LKSITKSSNIPLVMNLDSSSANTDYSKANLFNSTSIQYFMTHLCFLTFKTCQTYMMTLYLILPPLFKTSMKFLFHYMFTNLLVWTESLPNSTKLWSIGITGTMWSWFKTYLSARYQRVSINNCYSDLLPVVSGVPQGSILGPLYF